ncbi:NAD(P)-binding protein [Polyplosphaeria fusca]|uniref:NAD(P)-binding protein n=1 Tax=Polyplosphaeria fusca TaxID=682080 RepID=A0A9P4V4Z9_9PLEO|nr:NAD(P)-binding protein [Polyplosphaeria fusca]
MASSLTHPEWNQETGGLDVAKAFSRDIQGKKVLITGVSSESIGSSTALAIASQKPALLLLASRTQSKLDEVVRSIHDAYPNVQTKTVILDLMSQQAVRRAAEEVLGITDELDVIINNAGIMTPTRLWTVEGIEGQFGAGHIGHFLFTNLLVSRLQASARSKQPGATRVVNLTSLGHRLSPIRFHDYNFEDKPIPDEEKHPENLPALFLKYPEGQGVYNGYISYGQAKTANILFSVGLNQRLRHDGIVSYAVHPGSIWTGLSRDLDAEGQQAIRKTAQFWKNHDQGAATTLVAAFDPALNEQNGILLHDCQLFDAAPHATDPEIADRLWILSEELTKSTFKL